MHPLEKTHRVDKIESTHRDSMRLRNAEFVIKISGTESGREFTFILKGAHLQVLPGHEVPKKGGGGNVSEDWYEALTEEERLDVMQAVCAHYRKASRDPDGMKTAAIGIVNNPDTKAQKRDKHLIYVGINNHYNTDKVSKGCAEQGMVKAASNSITQYMYHNRDEEVADVPFIKEVFVMGGRAPNPNIPGDKGMGAICPCGQCTDLLARAMLPGGNVYVLPPTKGFEHLAVNHKARQFSDVVSGQVWKTTIDNLNRYRVIAYDNTSFEKRAQRDGLAETVARLANFSLPEVSDEVAAQAARNEKQRRKSIAALDVATRDGKPDAEAINNYLYHEILEGLHDRLTVNRVPFEPQRIRSWLTGESGKEDESKVKYVRAVVMQLDDGTYCSSYDSVTGSDNAFVSAESSALGANSAKLGTQGIKHVWTMEFNPRAIAGGVMITPTKDALERIYKRHTKIPGQHVTISNIPFNSQLLEKTDLQAMINANTFRIEEMYPGMFAGNGIKAAPPKPGGSPFQKYLNRAPDTAARGI